ncbi:3-keto-5-aminohexanoate cleavage enzyme [Desulfacinum hydrothermale DSM 13146]|uniref:3-keto-5-aminohexanoate cleavage enzyme n=1 Tax=Desulfacinum hydrothermale DSM 13146 TaxID=1121390 RepID=A0A1W1XAZ4_9BACT|nr:3-keto-5-aminohexanoate cleavage protein [Desulfacinum hydrothermale]SMC21040.1 3-keto-5-aminohexanoate cleavage enzyme [Desulfacinum hydrothermale DSM 13146]
MEKLIITVALTGNVPTKEMNPHVPITAEEIAQDVRRCADAGAVLFHVHARDANGRPTLDIERFKENVRRIKEVAPEVIIQLSTGARAGKDWEARANPVRLLPEMASFTTGSNNLPGIVYENSPQFIQFLAQVFKETGVKPEIEVFETGMINNALYLQKKGLIQGPLHFDFVLGAPGSMPGSVKNLLFLSESIPSGSTWSVAGIAKAEIPLATTAIVLGGHVRVGLEDNLTLPDGSPATNPKLVEKVVRIAREVGREIAGPDEARRILNLDPAQKDRILSRID